MRVRCPSTVPRLEPVHAEAQWLQSCLRRCLCPRSRTDHVDAGLQGHVLPGNGYQPLLQSLQAGQGPASATAAYLCHPRAQGAAGLQAHTRERRRGWRQETRELLQHPVSSTMPAQRRPQASPPALLEQSSLTAEIKVLLVAESVSLAPLASAPARGDPCVCQPFFLL